MYFVKSKHPYSSYPASFPPREEAVRECMLAVADRLGDKLTDVLKPYIEVADELLGNAVPTTETTFEEYRDIIADIVYSMVVGDTFKTVDEDGEDDDAWP